MLVLHHVDDSDIAIVRTAPGALRVLPHDDDGTGCRALVAEIEIFRCGGGKRYVIDQPLIEVGLWNTAEIKMLALLYHDQPALRLDRGLGGVIFLPPQRHHVVAHGQRVLTAHDPRQRGVPFRQRVPLLGEDSRVERRPTS